MNDLKLTQEIKDTCIKKFGMDFEATVNIYIHPLTNENNISIKISLYKLYDGSSKLDKEIFFHSNSLKHLLITLKNIKSIK